MGTPTVSTEDTIGQLVHSRPLTDGDTEARGHRGPETPGLLQLHGVLVLVLAALGGFISGHSSLCFPRSRKMGKYILVL